MTARIFRPAKSAMSSGTAKTRDWVLEFPNETGRAVVSRMQTQDIDPSMRRELFDSFAETPEPSDIKANLGIDKTTSILLDQRFQRDLELIDALPRARVF